MNFVPHTIHRYFFNFQPGVSTFSQACKLSVIGFLFQASCPRAGNYVKVSHIEIGREVVRPSMVFPTVIPLYSIFYSHSAMHSSHMSTDLRSGSRLSPNNWLSFAPFADLLNVYHQPTTDRFRVGAFVVMAANSFVVLLLTVIDGRVQHLTSSHSRPTDGVARAGWRRAIHEWRSRARV